MYNSEQPRFNAFHYIIVGVLGFFAGSLGGFTLCAVTQPPRETSIFCWMLGGAIVGAAALPTLLRVFDHQAMR